MQTSTSIRNRQKAIEFSSVERVAEAQGTRALQELGCWPDAWLLERSGQKIPVEVVSAYQRRPGEDPRKGAPSLVAYKKAERAAQEIERTGTPAAFGTHLDQGFAIPMDGQHALPLPILPVHPVEWVLTSIQQKMRKRYAQEMETILVVQFQWMALEPYQLDNLAKLLAHHGCRFRQVWIVSDFGDVQRVPLLSRGDEG